MSLDQQLESLLSPVATFATDLIFYTVPLGDADLPLIVLWLGVASLFFTLYFGFLNLRGFNHAFKVVRGDYANPNDPGEVSHFQALATALSGTVGLGNIAGVAIAVSLGGPGATFWMIVAGLLGMSSKFVECSLGLKHRRITSEGKVLGGPMYYLESGLAELGHKKLGKGLALFFAVCCVFASLCGSNMLQANQAYQQFLTVTGDDSFWLGKGWLFGALLACLIGAVIIGGIRNIARVTSKVVPLMALVYVGAALFILISHYAAIPEAFALIIKGAFSAEGVTGGMVGVMIQGFKRATFSSEAGVGAASIAHATATTREPIREGYVALLEPFIDTVVICTMTALVIVITGQFNSGPGLDGVTLTSQAFASEISWFPYVLSLAVLLFAVSTMISWAYYGSIAWGYLVGDGHKRDLAYKLVFCLFTVIGAASTLNSVIALSDAMFFSMAIANIVGLYMLAPGIKRDLARYQQTYIKRS